jgi:hypothetical protein
MSLNIEPGSSPSFQNPNQKIRELRIASGLLDLTAVCEKSKDWLNIESGCCRCLAYAINYENFL